MVVLARYTRNLNPVTTHSTSDSGRNPHNLLLYYVQIRTTKDSHAAKKNPHY